MGLERLEHLANVPIQFGQHIPIDAPRALALKSLRSEQRRVREGMGQVEEEWTVLVRADELHGLRGVARRQLRLVGSRLE